MRALTAAVAASAVAAASLAEAQPPTPAQCCGAAGPGPQCPGGSASGAGSFCNKGPNGKNVLFLAADDMRPEISPYGHKYMHTPNMQSLADDGYTMRRMFVQMALCAPVPSSSPATSNLPN